VACGIHIYRHQVHFRVAKVYVLDFIFLMCQNRNSLVWSSRNNWYMAVHTFEHTEYTEREEMRITQEIEYCQVTGMHAYLKQDI
jgi:hypothetical protein